MDSVFATGQMEPVSWAKPSVRTYLAILILIVGIVGGAAASSRPPFFIGIVMVLYYCSASDGLANLFRKFRKASSESLKAGLVISPSRFVLQSKILNGEMVWSELKGAELKPNSRVPSILRLKLDGVDIDLADGYQLPLGIFIKKSSCFARSTGRIFETPNRSMQIRRQRSKRKTITPIVHQLWNMLPTPRRAVESVLEARL